MSVQHHDLDQDEVRRTLQAIIAGVKATLTMQIIERETTKEALKSFVGQEDFDHYKHTLNMYDTDISFQQAKLAVAEAKLAELD